MDRSQGRLAVVGELEREDFQYWKAAKIKEKLQTITYLRECFYGPEATAGRLPEFYQILKQK